MYFNICSAEWWSSEISSTASANVPYMCLQLLGLVKAYIALELLNAVIELGLRDCLFFCHTYVNEIFVNTTNLTQSFLRSVLVCGKAYSRANISGQNKQLYIRKWVQQLIADNNQITLILQEEAGYTLINCRFQLVTAEHLYIVGEIKLWSKFRRIQFHSCLQKRKMSLNIEETIFLWNLFSSTLLFQPHKSMIKVFVSILLTNVQGNRRLSYCELHISLQGNTCHILQCSKINKSWEKCTKSPTTHEP